jgi:hypothetical protein
MVNALRAALPAPRNRAVAYSALIRGGFSMSAAHAHQARYPAQRRQAKRNSLLTLPALMIACAIALSFGIIAYVLWPRWPGEPVALDAPSIPVTIGGATFNIPPAAIRRPVQRRPGTQERIDASFLWPSLKAPDPATRPEPILTPGQLDRVFVTITATDGLPASERIKTIYPRYLDARIVAAPNGLAARPFKDATPYQGEELIYDPQDAERFTTRCSQNGKASTIGVCLYERRIGDADVVVRFPRDWLTDWQNVRAGLETLVANFRATVR